MSGFGLVTQQNSQSFVPFNSSVAPFGPDSGCETFEFCVDSKTEMFIASVTPTQQGFATQEQQNDAFAQWLQGKPSSTEHFVSADNNAQLASSMVFEA